MKRLYFLTALLIWVGCKEQKDIKEHTSAEVRPNVTSIADKIANLKDSKNKEVMVVAHRGDWRNAPENSIQAIQNCIDMGVDMVEIDIRETKDGHLVLMHDETIDRTTTGKGAVKEWTLDSLRTLRLKDGLGVPTPHGIPTLEEALRTTKDKILVNLDKSYPIFDKCFQIVKMTGTLDQVIIKGTKTRAEVEQEFGAYLDQVYFMPVIRLKNGSDQIVSDYIKHRKPVAFEFIVTKDTLGLDSYFNQIRKEGSGVWVNSLWPRLSAGHDDEKAAMDINTYQWYIDNNIDIIQTDRPKLLLEFLRNKNLHN
ncbi:glycerophosphodiester phosphodiesterase family protein [Flagellimonas sp.]|uniref:glycerophosphodiester phosphodiesterase family protein n=1 Tax=Flagellimonas sp. TaxID=2058762 RepID=UPI003BAECE77